MKRLLTLAGICVLASLAHAQGVRIGDDRPANTVQAVAGVGSAVYVAIPNAIINICSTPANAVPCTNKAATYTDATLTVACSNSAQIVLSGTSTCVGSADAQGNWGAWVASGQYAFTVTANGASSGPYFLTAGGSGGGSSVWGGIGGTLANQTDLSAALGAKANSLNSVFSGPITIDTPPCSGSVLFNDGGTIGGDCGFTYNKSTGQITWPSTFQVVSTWPGTPLTPPGGTATRLGIDTNGQFKTCIGSGACTPAGATNFTDGTATVPGFPGVSHPELGLGAALSKIAYAVTNVQRTSNVVTITVTTPVTNLNWPTSATMSVFGLPSPYDVLNCAICTLTAVTGGNPSTFTYTLAGPDIASSATTGSASLFDLYFPSYAIEFNRLESSTSNPARIGSIRLAPNDAAYHRGCSNTCDLWVIGGDGNDRVQLGDTTGVDIIGPMWGTETTAPSGSASIDQFWPDSTAHRWKMKNNNGSAVTIAALENAETVTGAWSFTNGGAGVTITGLFSTPYLNAGSAVPVIQTVGKGLQFLEAAAPSGAGSYDFLYADSTAHRWVMNNNNGGAFNIPGVSAAATSGNCPKFAANGIDLVDAASTCGPLPSTSFLTIAAGGTASTTLVPVNTTKLWAFTVTDSFTTTKVGYDVQTADNSADLYDFGIYDSTGTNLVCDVGATVGSTLMSSATVKSRAWTASCTLNRGRYYFAVTDGTSSTGVLGGLSLYPSPVCGVAPSANSTTSGGQLNSSVTPPADSYGNCTFPAVTFF